MHFDWILIKVQESSPKAFKIGMIPQILHIKYPVQKLQKLTV